MIPGLACMPSNMMAGVLSSMPTVTQRDSKRPDSQEGH